MRKERELMLSAKRGWPAGLGIVWVLISVACVDSSTPTPPIPPVGKVLYAVHTEPRGIVMAVGDTLPLSAVPLDIEGNVIDTTGQSPILFASNNPTCVKVSPTGILAAAQVPDQPVVVTARWVAGGVTKVDSISVAVTATRQSVSSVHLLADGTLAPQGAYETVFAVATAADGSPLPAVNAYFFVDPSVGFLVSAPQPLYGASSSMMNNGFLKAFWLHMTTSMYGVAWRDSLRFQGTYPATAIAFVQEDTLTHLVRSTSLDMVLSPCGSVTFVNGTSRDVDFVFDDSTHVGGCFPDDTVGNIRILPSNSFAVRSFPVQRTFNWMLRRSDGGTLTPSLTGRITIKNSP